jgi:hypothetical protein
MDFLRQTILLTTAIYCKERGLKPPEIAQKCYDESRYEDIRNAEINLNNAKKIINKMEEK